MLNAGIETRLGEREVIPTNTCVSGLMQSKLMGRPDGFLHSELTFTGYNKMEPKHPADLVYPVC